MKATLLLRERVVFGEDAFAELALWRLPRSAPGSTHPYKYRLAYVRDDACLLRYDNETGKGDHRHLRGREQRYQFESPEKLIDDFLRDARRIHREDRDT